ncbi:MAG: M20/M25/M40 family metallo-hydrolase [Bacteroidales bacterium]|nr:M20/M25/M40 family metallo-hydrolase [Bacteroidales bacterium]
MADTKLIDNLKSEAVALLREMVRIESATFNEEAVCLFLKRYLSDNGLEPEKIGNNLICRNIISQDRANLMLNAHIDTVPPCAGYDFDPFNPPLSDEKVYGLGSNDDGASAVAMIQTFIYFKEHPEECPVNLALVLSAEEERSGEGGIPAILPYLSEFVNFAIIGEPTGMKAAIAERGLIVIDGKAPGKSAHAARAEEGENAIYNALADIAAIRETVFDKVSPTLGAVKLSVTQISAGTVHNVIPEECSFVVDIRPTERYRNEEIVAILQSRVRSTLTPRTLNKQCSVTPSDHPLMRTIERLGIEKNVSPTTSNWTVIPFPSVKMGPGESVRSHKKNEFVFISEIEDGIEKYIEFIENIVL